MSSFTALTICHPIDRQMFSCKLLNRAPLCVGFIWEDKSCNCESLVPSVPPSFLQLLFLDLVLYHVEYPFVSWGSSVLTISPHNLLCIPRPHTGKATWRKKRMWSFISTAKKELEYWCVVNIFFTNTKHSTINKLSPSQNPPCYCGFV